MSIQTIAVSTLIALTGFYTLADDPNSAQIIQMSRKAVGGEAFFKPAPYKLDSLKSIKVKPNEGESKTIIGREWYKDGKYRYDCTVTIKRIGKPFNGTTISDLKNEVTWELQSPTGSRWRKLPFVIEPVLPPYMLEVDNWLLEPMAETVTINDVDYYKISATSKEPKNRTKLYYINKNNYFLHQIVYTEISNGVVSTKQISTFTNYLNVKGVVFPMQSSISYVSGKEKIEQEIEISNFAFSNDIPDSLFHIPKK